MVGSGADRLSLWHARIAAAVALGVGAIYALVPAARPALTLENQWLESATALTFGVGAVVGFVAFWRRPRAWAAELLLPLASLVGLLDELSFGHGLVAFQLPELRGMPIDGVHDLFLVAYSVFETDNPVYLVAYVVLALGALGAAVWWARPHGPLNRLWKRAAFLAHERPALRYLGLALLFLVAALVLDLDLVERPWLLFVEELLELEIALALAFGGAAVGGDPSWSARSPSSKPGALEA